MELNGLKCSFTLEHVTETGEIQRKQVFKTARLDLGRNEVEDVVLLLTHPEGRQGPFTVKEHSIHKRFLKDGKATIRLLPQKIHILISNCPPEQLSLFLRSMTIKLAARGKVQGAKRRMLGDISRQFDEISPLNERDLEMARRNVGTKGGRGGKENQVTPLRTVTCRTGKTSLTTPSRVDVCGSKATKRKLAEVSSSSSNGESVSSTANPAKKPALLRHTSGPPLSPEQTKVIEHVKNGENVFFTGSAGTGKSFLLKRIIGTLPPETTFATASTGAAACLIGGTTLHAFAGIGTGNGTLQHCIGMASRERCAVAWRKCQCLIIDEISMIDGEFFDKLEGVARAVRKNRRPFGGIQLVLCGDFLQLPPVCKDGEKRQYCFQARSWRSCITRSIELTDIYRQNDKQFIAVLQNIRIGRCPPQVVQLLQATSAQEIERGTIQATRLYTHKEDVEATNTRELAALEGAVKTFVADDSDPQMTRVLNGACPVAHNIELKIGAQVMLAKNINIQRGLVNGARGVVKKFDQDKGYPVIQFISGLEVVVGTEKWSIRTGGGAFITRKQLPLKLAWAISIHKSQGMTLDCVELSLGRCFEDGQAYVALSRARSLRTIRVKDFNPSCVRAHKDVLDFYRGLRRMRRNYIDER